MRYSALSQDTEDAGVVVVLKLAALMVSCVVEELYLALLRGVTAPVFVPHLRSLRSSNRLGIVINSVLEKRTLVVSIEKCSGRKRRE
jgi:hypothetical protein